MEAHCLAQQCRNFHCCRQAGGALHGNGFRESSPLRMALADRPKRLARNRSPLRPDKGDVQVRRRRRLGVEARHRLQPFHKPGEPLVVQRNALGIQSRRVEERRRRGRVQDKFAAQSAGISFDNKPAHALVRGGGRLRAAVARQPPLRRAWQCGHEHLAPRLVDRQRLQSHVRREWGRYPKK